MGERLLRPSSVAATMSAAGTTTVGRAGKCRRRPSTRESSRRDAFSAPRHSPAPFDGVPLSPGLSQQPARATRGSPSHQLVMMSSRLIIAGRSSRGAAPSMNRRVLRPATARPSVLSCSWVANRPHRYRAPVDEPRTCSATLARVAKRCARRFHVKRSSTGPSGVFGGATRVLWVRGVERTPGSPSAAAAASARPRRPRTAPSLSGGGGVLASTADARGIQLTFPPARSSARSAPSRG